MTSRVLLFLVTLSIFHQIHTKTLLSQKKRTINYNKIANINSTCDLKTFNITIETADPFKGVLFAKEFSQECRKFGTMKNSLTLNLPTAACGVRLGTSSNGKMFYEVIIIVQQDKHLQQFTDQERNVQCFVTENIFNVNSRKMADIVKKEMISEKKHNRNGRMQKWEIEDKNADELNSYEIKDELNEALNAATAWMQIEKPSSNNKSNNFDLLEKDKGTLQVGDEAYLVVKSTLPEGIGWNVIDCTAHDGLGDSSQKLLDDNGCPIDELLMPKPLKGPVKAISRMRHQEAVAKFSAFKFPDRDRLHFNCGLQLCKGACPNVNCANKSERFGKQMNEEILDRLQVFNSVKVLAPGIEMDEETRESVNNRKINNDLLISPFGDIPGDRTFCISTDKMALTFCILGLIFLTAIAISAFALFRARQNGTPVMPYYTRSLFSSSSGSGSAYGSKLLLHESPTGSATSAHRSSTSLRGYGRII